MKRREGERREGGIYRRGGGGMNTRPYFHCCIVRCGKV